ncbi:MAG: ornithine cyclodeaminase family protein, partial [Tistlia sp.]
MRTVAAKEVQAALDFPSLVETLREGFRGAVAAPVRHHHSIPRTGEPDATLLLMPAWQSGRHVGIKIVTVTPGNAERSLPAVMGIYLLNDWTTGQPLALIDGPMLTLRRTAAASALGASYLARQDSERLLMV